MVMSRDEFITICDELRGVINKHIKNRDLQIGVPVGFISKFIPRFTHNKLPHFQSSTLSLIIFI